MGMSDVDELARTQVSGCESGTRSERAPVTQASACVLPLKQRLLWRYSRRSLFGILDRVVSDDPSAAKWRPGLRRDKRSQHRERLRSDRNGNDYDRCCTSHGRRSYRESSSVARKNFSEEEKKRRRKSTERIRRREIATQIQFCDWTFALIFHADATVCLSCSKFAGRPSRRR